MFAAAVDVWRFQPHPEVWLLIVGVVALGYYAAHVIGPSVVADGQPVVTGAQTGYFAAAVALLWVASDWPMHDVSEEYLYSVHMIQHLLMTFVIPPLFLLATPQWLARLVVSGDGTAGVWVRRLARPLVAGIVFNALIALSHAPVVVNASVESGPLHYGVHVALFTAALAMWMPVCGPLPELRISLPGQMIYLFLMSIIPTIPAAWLTFAEGAVYSAYDHQVRLWGIGVAADQQAAGLIMKIVGGTFLWAIIALLFYRWASQHSGDNVNMRTVTSSASEATGSDLTYEAVVGEFDRLGDPPREPIPGDGS